MTGNPCCRVWRSSASHFSRSCQLPHAVGAEKDRDGAAGPENDLQGLGSGLAGGQVPAVQEGLEPSLAQGPRNRLHGRLVAPVVAQEQIVSRGGVTHPEDGALRLLCAMGARVHLRARQ